MHFILQTLNTKQCYSYNNVTNSWDFEHTTTLGTSRGFAASVKISDNEIWFLGGEEVHNYYNWAQTTEICEAGGLCIKGPTLPKEGMLFPKAIQLDEQNVLVGDGETK